MKRLHSKYTLVTVFAVLLFASCKREDENIFNMFNDVTLTYHATDPKSITDYKLVSDGDTVYLDYTIESKKEDMEMICMLQPGSASPFRRVRTEAGQKRSFSELFKFVPDKVGKTTIRIYALNREGVYIGDGYKSITVEVVANYRLFAARRIYASDTTDMNVQSYFSVMKGQTYSYNDGAANAANIDLAVYSKLNISGTNAVRVYNIYSPTMSNPPFNLHNVSAWTKRDTKFSTPQTGQASTFSNLNTGGEIIAGGKNRKPTASATTSNLVAGSMFYFLTPEGQYGAVLVNSLVNNDREGNYISVDVKLAELPK